MDKKKENKKKPLKLSSTGRMQIRKNLGPSGDKSKTSGNKKTIDVKNGLSIMEGAIQNNIPEIDADCGGGMACATCHVYVKEEWFNKLPKAEDGEQDMIDMAFEPKKNSRLSCQLIVSDELDGIIVTTPSKQT